MNEQKEITYKVIDLPMKKKVSKRHLTAIYINIDTEIKSIMNDMGINISLYIRRLIINDLNLRNIDTKHLGDK